MFWNLSIAKLDTKCNFFSNREVKYPQNLIPLRYTAREVATFLMANKDPVDGNLESSSENNFSSAEDDLNPPIIPELDATYVSGSISESESCNNEEFSKTINEVLNHTISADAYCKTWEDAVKYSVPTWQLFRCSYSCCR